MRTFSLGTRLSLIIVAGTLVSVGAVLLIAYTALVNDFEDLLTRQQIQETRRLAQSVDQGLQYRLDVLQEFSNRLSDGVSLGSRAELQNQLNRQQILDRLFPGGLLILDAGFHAIEESFHVPGRLGTYYGDREHFRRVAETRQAVVSRPIMGRTTGVPLISFAAPILSDGGDLLGVVTGVVRLNESSLLPPATRAALTQDDARFMVIDTNNMLFIEGNRQGNTESPDQLPPPGQDELVDAALSGISFGRIRVPDGEELIYASSYLDPLGWQFIRAVPYARATAPATASFLRFFGISLVIAVTIAVLSFLAIRSATWRLDRMTRRIDTMVSEPLSGSRLDEEGPPEVMELAQAFNRLMDERDAMTQLKDNFVSNVSHELRTPLTAGNGALRLLQSQRAGELPGHARSLVDLALRNGQRLELLISDLLDFNKLASGQMSVVLAPTRLSTVVGNSQRSHVALAQEKGVELHNTVADSLWVQADGHRLQQVFDNLLSNAIKFSSSGDRVTLSAEHCDRGRIRIRFSDQGPGVPEAFEPRLFERFAQAESGTTRSMKGTGLGLAICRELIQLMHGDIGYYYQQGAHFWVELPETTKDALTDEVS